MKKILLAIIFVPFLFTSTAFSQGLIRTTDRFGNYIYTDSHGHQVIVPIFLNSLDDPFDADGDYADDQAIDIFNKNGDNLTDNALNNEPDIANSQAPFDLGLAILIGTACIAAVKLRIVNKVQYVQ